MSATADPVQVTNVLHSVSSDGVELLTQQLRYPRMVHADFLTHRVFSRNGRSSRAVPVATLLAEAADPYVPHFMRNKPGMQATEELTDEERAEAEGIWRSMAENVRRGVENLYKLGAHKQWSNRPLEWFGYIDVLVTSTYWTNFDVLRDDDGAQPEIQLLARKMAEARRASTPRQLKFGEWHMPYVTDEEKVEHGLFKALKLSTARCARLSIRPFSGESSIEAEVARYERLVGSSPVHASPAEHQATPDRRVDGKWENLQLHGNYAGWIQHRKTISSEAVMEFFA